MLELTTSYSLQGWRQVVVAAICSSVLSTAYAGVTATPEYTYIDPVVGLASPTKTVTFTAGATPVAAVTDCGFRNGGPDIVVPTIINHDSGSIPGAFAAGESVELAFSCDTSNEGYEQNRYSCLSSDGEFYADVACAVSAVGWLAPPQLSGPVGGPDHTGPAYMGANVDLTGISCDFIDYDTEIPITPVNISVTGGGFPSSLSQNGQVDTEFSCDASSVGTEYVVYRCNSDQGQFSTFLDCSTNPAVVLPEYGVYIEGVQGNPAPTGELEISTPYRTLAALACDFSSVPELISLSQGSIPASMAAGQQEALEFSCATATAGSEYASYGCSSDLGDIYGSISCSVRDRYPVEPLPERALMVGEVGGPLPTATVTLTAEGVAVTNVSACDFYGNANHSWVTTPWKISHTGGTVPTNFGAAESVDLSFSCDNSYGGSEKAYYGCFSDQGHFNVPVNCDIPYPEPEVASVYSYPMQGYLGGPSPYGNVQIYANSDISGMSCGFADESTGLPIVPERIALAAGTIVPTSIAGGAWINIDLMCDTSSIGSESLVYQCESDQGDFSAPISCNISPALVSPGSMYIQGVQGNPARSMETEITAIVDLDNLSCGFDSVPAQISLSAGAVPATMTAGDTTTLEFSCSTASAGYEDVSYTCSSDQGESVVRVACNNRARYPVEATPDAGTMSGSQGGGELFFATDLLAQGAPVTNVNSCGFYQGNASSYPAIPQIISLSSGSVPGNFASDDSVALSFACDDTYAANEWLSYSCDSDQGYFGVELYCNIVPGAVTMNGAQAQGAWGGPPAIAYGTLNAQADLTNVACEFVDVDTSLPIVPARISLSGAAAPVSMNAGAAHNLEFSCGTDSPGNESAAYRCSSDQGSATTQVDCEISAAQIYPQEGVYLNGIVGKPTPAAFVGIEAVAAQLDNVSCDFTTDPGIISLDESFSVPATLEVGQAHSLRFECDNSSPASSDVIYECSSDQGSTKVRAACNVRAPNLVEPWPGSVSMNLPEGMFDQSRVVQMEAANQPVTNINSCGFYSFFDTPVTPSTISLSNGVMPGSLAANEVVPLTFSCDASAAGSESAFYGCESDQGIFYLPVACNVSLPPTADISAPPVMKAELGAEDPTAAASVEATGLLSGLSCDFMDVDTHDWKVPERISLTDSSVLMSMSSGDVANLSFSCDASTEGSEEVLYGCWGDQSILLMAVGCEIESSSCASGGCGFMRSWRLAIPQAMEN